MTEQSEIDAACESLCDRLEEISVLQAKVMRCIYRDKLSHVQAARLCGIQTHRVETELRGAFSNLLAMMTNESFTNWSTPSDTRHPQPGISANARPAAKPDAEAASSKGGTDKAKGKAASVKKAKGTRQKRAAGPSQP